MLSCWTEDAHIIIKSNWCKYGNKRIEIKVLAKGQVEARLCGYIPYDGKFIHQSNTVCKQSCTGGRAEFPVFGIQVLAGQEILELVVAIAGSMQIFRCSQTHCCPPQVRHNQDGPIRELQSYVGTCSIVAKSFVRKVKDFSSLTADWLNMFTPSERIM